MGDHLLTGDRILLSRSDLGELKKQMEGDKETVIIGDGQCGEHVGVIKTAFGSRQHYVVSLCSEWSPQP